MRLKSDAYDYEALLFISSLINDASWIFLIFDSKIMRFLPILKDLMREKKITSDFEGIASVILHDF